MNQQMQYRTLPHGGEAISILGLGSGSLTEGGMAEAAATLTAAAEAGINYFDLAASEADAITACGTALAGVRRQVYYQIHFGANYETGSYGWTTDADKIRRSVDWQLRTLKTDYIDFGFLHCIDEVSDLEAITDGGVIAALEALKAQGVVRHIGMSTHSPALANRALDLGILDMLMFSINPAYDYCRGGELAIGSSDERTALYRRCAREGVGISAMKPFSGGQLLDAHTSPYGRALSEYQCLRYALDRPAVLTVLPGVRGRADLQRVLGYLRAGEAETDYSVLGTLTPAAAAGRCVYCNHCEPCPAGLDIGMINKYYDLALAGDALARGHYDKLAVQAGSCIGCGHCEARCPFGVRQESRMREIRAYFGA